MFVIGGEIGCDLELLLELVARGRLDPQVSWRGSWRQVGEVARALLEHLVVGKVVLEVT